MIRFEDSFDEDSYATSSFEEEYSDSSEEEEEDSDLNGDTNSINSDDCSYEAAGLALPLPSFPDLPPVVLSPAPHLNIIGTEDNELYNETEEEPDEKNRVEETDDGKLNIITDTKLTKREEAFKKTGQQMPIIKAPAKRKEPKYIVYLMKEGEKIEVGRFKTYRDIADKVKYNGEPLSLSKVSRIINNQTSLYKGMTIEKIPVEL